MTTSKQRGGDSGSNREKDRGRRKSEVAEHGTAEEAVLTLMGMISHELRTPIQTILANAELMGLMPLPAEAQMALQRLERSVDVALRRLDTITQYVRSAAALDQPESQSFDVHALIQSTVDECSVEAQANGQQIVTDCDNSLPAKVAGDPLRLQQILTNLLVNAVRHGDAGTIVVRCFPTTMTNTGAPAIAIEVHNPGPGIPLVDRDSVWQPFVRHTRASNRTKGMGLGLAVVRLLAAPSGWEVGLTEGRPATTVFFVRIPV
jgi:signal transduction histidine kinase